LVLSDRAFIRISELVVVENDHTHRLEYAYYLIVDGTERFARERDPTHDPPEHGHRQGHTYEEAGTISFKDFVERAWQMTSEEAEADGEEDPNS